MPLHSHKSEAEILNFIFRENSSLENNDKEMNINTYYAIKYHMPEYIFKSPKLKFNYNKGVSYILATFNEITLFKIPNTHKDLIQIICPPSKEFIKALEISETKKDEILKKYKDTNLKFWYANLTPEEVLCFPSCNWDEFTTFLSQLHS